MYVSKSDLDTLMYLNKSLPLDDLIKSANKVYKQVQVNGKHGTFYRKQLVNVDESTSYTSQEKDAVYYWSNGADGWGYRNIRDCANGHEPTAVAEQRKLGNDTKADDYLKAIKQMTKHFESAVKKSPSPKVTLTRFTPSFNVPAVGDTVKLDKFTSFTSKPTDKMYEDFARPDSVVYKIEGSSQFADISQIAGGAAAAEHECVTRDKLTFVVDRVEKEYIGGDDIPDWLKGDEPSGTPYNIVYLKGVGQ